MTSREEVSKTAQELLKYLTSFGEFTDYSDDDTDYVPAAYDILGLCLSALLDDDPCQACDLLVLDLKNLNLSDDLLADFLNLQPITPLSDHFDSDRYLGED